MSSQLGVCFSSNDRGDGPGAICHVCGEETTSQTRLCQSCYDKGESYPSGHCSVCLMRFGDNKRKRVSLPKKDGAAKFAAYLVGDTEDAVKFRATCAQRRDLKACPVREGDPLCNYGKCVYSHRNIAKRNGHLARQPPSRGETKPGPKPADLTGPCPLPPCQNRIEEPRARGRISRVGKSFSPA